VNRIWIPGTPRPQGSLQLAVNKVTGKGFAKYSSTTVEWRNVMYGALVDWWKKDPIDGPVNIALLFFLRRPRSHYGSGRNSDSVKESAPEYPKGPDIDKLCRAVLDSCTDAQVWQDDSQVVSLRADKRFATREEGTGVRLFIEQLT